MATIPDATSLISRGAPRSNRGGTVSFNSNAGAGLMQAGKVMGQVAADINEADEANNKVAAARAMLRLKQEEAAMDEAIRQNPSDYQNIRAQWKERYGKAYDEVKGTITNPKYSGLFDVAASEQFLQSDSRYANVQKGYRKEHVVADAIKRREETKLLVRPDMSPADLAALVKTNEVINSGYGDVLGEDEIARENILLKKDVDKQYLDSLPAGKAYELTSKQINRKTPIDTILANELDASGGVRVHGDGNGQAIGGIHYNPNKKGGKAFEKEFFEAKRILESQGQDAAKQYLRSFYDEKIIKANGIDKLPADVQDVVADGVTNHGGDFQKKLLEAARGGASRNELLDMRQAEYDRLVASPNSAENKWDAAKISWNNRIKGLRDATPQSSYKYDPDVAMSINKQSEAYVRRDTARKAADDMAAAEMGLSAAPALTESNFLGDQNEYDQYLIGFETAKKTHEYSGMSFQDVQADITASQPKPGDANMADKQKAIKIKEAAFKADFEKWEADSAKAAMESDPTVKSLWKAAEQAPDDATKTQAAVDATLKAQINKGVLKPRILTEDKANAFTSMIDGAEAKGGDNVLIALDGQRALYGEKNYAQIIGEIAPKLSPSVRAVSALNLSDKLSVPVAKDIMQSSSKPIADLAEVLPSGVPDAIKQAVNKKLEPLQKTLYMSNAGYGASTYNAVRDSALRAAYTHAGRGNSAEDAATYAIAPFIKNYEFNGSYRVPAVSTTDPTDKTKILKTYAPSEAAPLIESASNLYLNKLTEGDLMMPKEYKDNFAKGVYLDAVKAKGQWVMNDDETALRLVDQFGTPVFDKSGAGVRVKLSDLVFEAEKIREEAKVLDKELGGYQ